MNRRKQKEREEDEGSIKVASNRREKENLKRSKIGGEGSRAGRESSLTNF